MIIPSLVASYFRSRISNAFVDDSLWSLIAFFLYNRTEAGDWELQMIADRPPRSKRLLEEFGKSERLTRLVLPEDGRLATSAKAIEEAMSSERRAMVCGACEEFLSAAADFYDVRKATVRVLASRPVRVYESGWSTELFGDYDPEQNLTRVWTRPVSE